MHPGGRRLSSPGAPASPCPSLSCHPHPGLCQHWLTICGECEEPAGRSPSPVRWWRGWGSSPLKSPSFPVHTWSWGTPHVRLQAGVSWTLQGSLSLTEHHFLPPREASALLRCQTHGAPSLADPRTVSARALGHRGRGGEASWLPAFHKNWSADPSGTHCCLLTVDLSPSPEVMAKIKN